jgi:uncharacterized protein (DUF3084 family)
VGFSDLHTYQYPSAQQQANKFLIVQCKRTRLETRTSTWNEGVQQLDQYLSATHRTRHVNQTLVYGIVAAGMHMRVYQYDNATNSVGQLVISGEIMERAIDSTQPQKVAAASDSTPRTQKKEQRTDTSITRSARAVDDEVAKATLQIERMELDDSIEAERKALDVEMKEMEARWDSLNAQQNALEARSAQRAKDKAAMQPVVDRALQEAGLTHISNRIKIFSLCCSHYY